MKSKRCSHNLLQSDYIGFCQRIFLLIMHNTSKTKDQRFLEGAKTWQLAEQLLAIYFGNSQMYIRFYAAFQT